MPTMADNDNQLRLDLLVLPCEILFEIFNWIFLTNIDYEKTLVNLHQTSLSIRRFVLDFLRQKYYYHHAAITKYIVPVINTKQHCYYDLNFSMCLFSRELINENTQPLFICLENYPDDYDLTITVFNETRYAKTFNKCFLPRFKNFWLTSYNLRFDPKEQKYHEIRSSQVHVFNHPVNTFRHFNDKKRNLLQVKIFKKYINFHNVAFGKNGSILNKRLKIKITLEIKQNGFCIYRNGSYDLDGLVDGICEKVIDSYVPSLLPLSIEFPIKHYPYYLDMELLNSIITCELLLDDRITDCLVVKLKLDNGTYQ